MRLKAVTHVAHSSSRDKQSEKQFNVRTEFLSTCQGFAVIKVLLHFSNVFKQKMRRCCVCENGSRPSFSAFARSTSHSGQFWKSTLYDVTNGADPCQVFDPLSQTTLQSHFVCFLFYF